MPTNGHEGHDMGKPEGVQAHPAEKFDDNHPGYEIQDVNVAGISTFLAGLFGFVLVFFVFCFFMGKVINNVLLKQDGPVNKWQPNLSQAGATPTGAKLEDLASNAEVQQRQLQAMTQTFPTPRLEADDGNQDTADLHAREDLLLEHYSSTPGQPGIRIPIERAMELIAEKGLPVSPAAQTSQKLAYDTTPMVTAPLTSGFARTGFELDAIEARKQKMETEKPEPAAHAELKPIK